jgi:hypothetical protein
VGITSERGARVRSISGRDSRRAAIMVGDAFLSAKAGGDAGNQVRLLEMMGNGFNEEKRFGEALAFFERAIKTSGPHS